jgi:hypothetical protein
VREVDKEEVANEVDRYLVDNVGAFELSWIGVRTN